MKKGLSNSLTSDKFYQRLPLYRLLAAVLIAIVAITCCIQQIWRRDGDPELFVHAARLLLRGQDIYTIPNHHGSFYYYPPFFACLNIPLIPLPINIVIVLWAFASVGLLGWSMTAFYSGMTGQPFYSLPVKTRWVVCFFSTLLTARFTILHLRFGQSNIFVLALVVLGLTWLIRKQSLRAGIAIGLSIMVKLITLPFGFWFLARRGNRILLGMLLGGLIGVMLPALIVGFNQDVSYHQEWVERVALSNAPGTGNWTSNGNVSLRAQADRFFLKATAFQYKESFYHVTIVELPVVVVRLIGWLMMLCIGLVIGLYAVRFKSAPELVSQWGGFAFVFSLIPNFSPVSEIPHLILLLPAYIYVVHLWYVQRLTDRVFRVLIVLSFIFTTLTTNTIMGMFLSRLLASLGFISLGMLLLSAAIFRAAIHVQRSTNSDGLTSARHSLALKDDAKLD